MITFFTVDEIDLVWIAGRAEELFCAEAISSGDFMILNSVKAADWLTGAPTPVSPYACYVVF